MARASGDASTSSAMSARVSGSGNAAVRHGRSSGQCAGLRNGVSGSLT
jgi:hypothetical protein